MIYLYHCQACRSDLEADYRMGDQPATLPCTHCGIEARRRYVSSITIPSSFQYGRTEFHATDAQQRAMDGANEAYQRGKEAKPRGKSYEQHFEETYRQLNPPIQITSGSQSPAALSSGQNATPGGN